MFGIVVRSPSRTLTREYRPWSFLEEVDTMARELWEGWRPYTYPYAYHTHPGYWWWPLDMYEEKDELVLRMELPGFKTGDIDISLEGDMLTIKAVRKPEEVSEDITSYICERTFGSYSRSVTLPYPVKADKISTCYENGILEIRLPKAEEAKAKHIPIKIETPKAIPAKSK